MKQAAKEFQTNEELIKWKYSNDAETFNWLWTKYTHKELDMDVNPITSKDVNIFRMGIKEFGKDLKKVNKRRWFAPFKIPAATMRKMPELDKYQDILAREASFFRLYKVENAAHNKLIIENWETLAAQVGGKASIKEFRNLEQKLDDALSIKNPTPDQVKQKNALRKEYSKFLTDGSVNVFKDFADVMHGIDIDTMEGYTPSQKALWREIDLSVQSIRKNGVTIISSALKKVMETAKDIDKREGSFRNLEGTIDLIKEQIRAIEFQSKVDREGMRPSQGDFQATSEMEALGFQPGEQVFLKKYMPHKLLGMVKVLRDANRLMIDGDKNKTQSELLEQDWDNFRKSVESAQHRSVLNENPYFSRDPSLFLRQYTNEISQFNFQAHLENNYRKQIGKLMEVSEKAVNENDKQLEEASESLMRQMRDMKDALVRIDPKSDQALANLSRLVTSIQYFRLMGGNVRSAARNATQRLYEFVHFGFKAHNSARGYYKGAAGNENNTMAEHEAKRHGLLWHIPESKTKLAKKAVVEEQTRGAIVEGSNVPLGYKIDSGGVMRREDSTSLTKKAAETASVVANQFGVFHRKVEDWNRKGTFKIAFALAHMNLKTSPDSWLAKKMNVDPSRTREDGWGAMKDKWIQRRAGNIAYNAVTDLHFEYSKWAKAKGIRGPGGQVIGQFLHYRFSLFDLMSRWWKDGSKAIKAGDFNREEAWRLYRLGILHTMITGASIGMSTQWSSLVENDVVETADRLWLLMSADREDPEEVKNLQRKTYRQGALSFAGPLVGHVMQFGEWMNWMSIDHNGQPHHPTQQIVATGDEYRRKQRWKGRSLINSQLARTSTYTFPVLVKQGVIDALKLELGLFPKRELKEKQKKVQRLTREYVPYSWRNVGDYPTGLFPDIVIAPRKAPKGLRVKRRGDIAGPGTDPRLTVTPHEMSRVLGSLDYIRGESTASEVLREHRELPKYEGPGSTYRGSIR
jgi:hypothetical protein